MFLHSGVTLQLKSASFQNFSKIALTVYFTTNIKRGYRVGEKNDSFFLIIFHVDDTGCQHVLSVFY